MSKGIARIEPCPKGLRFSSRPLMELNDRFSSGLQPTIWNCKNRVQHLCLVFVPDLDDVSVPHDVSELEYVFSSRQDHVARNFDRMTESDNCFLVPLISSGRADEHDTEHQQCEREPNCCCVFHDSSFKKSDQSLNAVYEPSDGVICLSFVFTLACWRV